MSPPARPLPTDPYEQKLFSLFAIHENGNGFLDISGLNDLIQTLQLKERGSLLIDLLLKNGTRPRVTFSEFREGLLQVITSEDDGTAWSHSILLFVALRWWFSRLTPYL